MTEERQNAGEGGKSGQLKIFFGYAAGVGKTYAMLQAALTAEERGMDVVIGHDRKQLCHGLRDLSHGILWVVHPFPLLFMFMKILWITEKV